MRENERNWETQENSRSGNILMIKSFTKSCLGLIYYPGKAKLQKCVNYPLLMRVIQEKIQKLVKWVKKRGEPVSQCCENLQFSQVTKFRNLRNFAGCEKFSQPCSFSFFYFLLLLFLRVFDLQLRVKLGFFMIELTQQFLRG